MHRRFGGHHTATGLYKEHGVYGHLGVAVFYESAGDFGYDISNYRDCAPAYGTLATIDKLVAEVHRRDMRIIFDMVMNHPYLG